MAYLAPRVDDEEVAVSMTNGVQSRVTDSSSVLHQQISKQPPKIVSGRGNYLITDTRLEIFDASTGAAVACIVHANVRVKDAIVRQLDQVAYCYLPFFTAEPIEKLAKELADSTDSRMSKVFIVSSGKTRSLVNEN